MNHKIKAGKRIVKNKNCHSRCCRPQDSGIPTTFNNAQGGDPRLQISGMTPNLMEEALNKNDFRAPLRSGFTLIELLVVVLIIGILAAVVLPQYQRAVAKSRAMQGMALIKGLITSSEAYFLTYGEYPSSLDALDIKAPGNWNGNKKIYTRETADAKSNGEWSVVIQKGGDSFTNTSHIHGIHVGQLTGPYQGAGFSYIFNEKFYNVPTKRLYCSEFTDSDAPFKKAKGDFCVKLFGGKVVYDYPNADRYYEITNP